MRREFGYALLAGAAGAGLILLAVRQQWARAVFSPPQPLPQQVIAVRGQDLVPVAGALAIAALAGLAAVIATGGIWRRIAGGLLAVFGVGAGVAVLTATTAAQVVSVAAGHAGSPGSSALSGSSSSSTTGGTLSHGSPVVVSGTTGHAIMSGAGWRAAVLIGAVAIVCAGLSAAWRGGRWPVMSARFERSGFERSGRQRQAGADSASLWESLSSGDDPTEAAAAGDPADAADTPGSTDAPDTAEASGTTHSPGAADSPGAARPAARGAGSPAS